MPLIIVKPEDVREGEPRWWCGSRERADRMLREPDAVRAEYIVGDPSKPTNCQRNLGWPSAIVDRPLPASRALLYEIERLREIATEPPRAWEVLSDTGSHLHILVGHDADGRARAIASLYGGATVIPLYRREDRAIAAAVRDLPEVTK